MKCERQPMAWSCIACSTQSDTAGQCLGGCNQQLQRTPQRAPRHDHDREEDAA